MDTTSNFVEYFKAMLCQCQNEIFCSTESARSRYANSLASQYVIKISEIQGMCQRIKSQHEQNFEDTKIRQDSALIIIHGWNQGRAVKLAWTKEVLVFTFYGFATFQRESRSQRSHTSLDRRSPHSERIEIVPFFDGFSKPWNRFETISLLDRPCRCSFESGFAHWRKNSEKIEKQGWLSTFGTVSIVKCRPETNWKVGLSLGTKTATQSVFAGLLETRRRIRNESKSPYKNQGILHRIICRTPIQCIPRPDVLEAFGIFKFPNLADYIAVFF